MSRNSEREASIGGGHTAAAALADKAAGVIAGAMGIGDYR
jgi:hypothetical protein